MRPSTANSWSGAIDDRRSSPQVTDKLPTGDYLNVGSGPHVEPGWISIDGSWQARLAARPMLARVASAVARREVGHWPHGIVCRDVRQGLGWPPASVAAIYSSHFIEHLRRDEALRFLRDCRGALKPGGVCRVVTPDLRALARRYLDAPVSDRAAADLMLSASLLVVPEGTSAGGLLGWYRQRTRFETHKWLYDQASLKGLFQEAGFKAPQGRDYLQSHIPADILQRVENRERIEGGAGIVVEATA